MNPSKQKGRPVHDQFRSWSEADGPQARSLSGSSPTFGARQLGEFAGEIERVAVAGMLDEAELRYDEVASSKDAASEALTMAVQAPA